MQTTVPRKRNPAAKATEARCRDGRNKQYAGEYQ